MSQMENSPVMFVTRFCFCLCGLWTTFGDDQRNLQKVVRNSPKIIKNVTIIFINVFGRRATGLHWQAKLFELNFFNCEKNFPL